MEQCFIRAMQIVFPEGLRLETDCASWQPSLLPALKGEVTRKRFRSRSRIGPPVKSIQLETAQAYSRHTNFVEYILPVMGGYDRRLACFVATAYRQSNL